MTSFNRLQFKNKIIIFCVIHYNYECVYVTLKNIIAILDQLPDVYLILISSAAKPDVQALFDSIEHKRIDKVHLPINVGYNHSVNFYIRDFINDDNLPRVIIRLDADILFDQADFESLVDACEQLTQFSIIGMSYYPNECNPQLNTPFKARKFKGKNNKEYSLKIPFMTPISGGIMAFRGSILKHDLHYQPFQPKYLPKKFVKITPVGGADSSLYNALKGKYKMGYLEGTTAYHLKSRDNTIVNIPEKYNSLLK
tara:strand:+ start:2396 stop:3157 length:762 start_codon:yes stop_codon:yes gene_type:complete